MGPNLIGVLHRMIAASLAISLWGGGTQAQEVNAPPKGAPAPVLSLDGEFVAQQLDGAELSRFQQAQRPRISFLDQNRIAGFSGCRAFSGRLIHGANGTTRLNVATNVEANCLGQLAKLDNLTLSSLKATRRLEALGDEVRLLGNHNKILMRLTVTSPRADQGLSLYGHTWVLTRMNGVEISKDSPKPTLAFQQNTLSGYSGCNHFSGFHTRQAGKSKIIVLTISQRACIAITGDPMELETTYLQALARVDVMALSDSTMTLSASQGGTVLVFAIAR
ncbi:META domain-containing protein [Candidatus Phycosocius spiralis]|uniref:DUF306 domain-containing protein n=1 Tax=Candidatus Phycosocius spiralis TaxID=2815099 RepID=A0ABQ4PVC4_9PROT|nr:META domain-containing protein [Candidatus Phycosocius spiralis]GIU66834.1 hypothetical protein PsB1_0988 [Candidatus Phycosocius spiralis]